MNHRRLFITPLVAAPLLMCAPFLLACDHSQTMEAKAPAPPPPSSEGPPQAPSSPPPQKSVRATNVYFGDLHLHTGLSLDAGLEGTTTTPDDAYRFARGEDVTASKGSQAKLEKPLDFVVVSEHAENLGFLEQLRAGNPRLLQHPKGKQWHEGLEQGGHRARIALADLSRTHAAGKFPKELELTPEETQAAWSALLAVAEQYNEPGKFTAFIGYEWTSMPQSRSMHRVVILKDGADKAGQTLPFSANQSDDPEKLWEALEQYEQQSGGSAIAIPHSANFSNGQMFALERGDKRPFDKAYAERRQRFEPLYEVTQLKGSSEAHPLLSPDDRFADFEIQDRGNLDLSEPTKPEQLSGDYAREAYKAGVKLAMDLGVNPFKFGLVGSTDSHTGLATADDSNFYGEHGGHEPSKGRLRHPLAHGKAGEFKAWQMAASGYAAVWAEENSRQAIFEAMQRRETYATTGPRISVRFFGAWDFTASDLEGDWVKSGYQRGVPMGGELGIAPAGRAPTFLVAANKEEGGANLDRIQIVKGWADAQGETHEKVYDVVWSGGRLRDADGTLPSVGNTIDTKEWTYENSIGSPELAKVWMDPEFDPKVNAFYYLRVLEIPTPRWTAYDIQRFGVWLPRDVPRVTQERAYTSPIWVQASQ